MATRVVLVRHGQSSYNAAGRIQGRCDNSQLTDRGAADAVKVAAALNGIPFAAAYCSPLQRAKRTAEIIIEQIETPPALAVSDGLLEVDLPLWEGLSREEVRSQYAELYRQWHEAPHELVLTVPDGQGGSREHAPVLALFEQARQFWKDLLERHRDQTVLLVAHNGILRSLIATALGVDPSAYQVIRQSNCGISVLNFADGTNQPAQLECLNLTAPLGDALPDRGASSGVRLLLVRHGETDWNRQKRFQGQIDIPLNDNGRAQARSAAEFLAPIQIDFAVSSPMARPKETAELILERYPNCELSVDDRLQEIGHGLWEGKLEEEIAAEFGELLQLWKDQPEQVQMPEGENLQEVWDRSVAAWEAIVANAPEGSTGLVVAHDAVNKVILCHVLGLSPADIWSIKQGNGAVTVVDYPKRLDSRPVLQAMNLTLHLDGAVLDRTAAGAL